MAERKVDRRILRTRKALGDALISLMLQEDYEAISIRRLTEFANIGYATFYRHFKSKNELLFFILSSALKELEDSFMPEMTTYDESVLLFKHIQENRSLWLAGTSLPMEHPTLKAIRKILARIITERYEAKSASTIPLDLLVNYLIKSAHDMARWYLEHGNDYSPDQMATIYNQLVLNATEMAAITKRESKEDGVEASHVERLSNANDATPKTPS